MSDGFLGRWSKRKLDVKQGKVVEAEPLDVALPAPSPQPSLASGRGSQEVGIPPSPLGGEGRGEGTPDQPPPPTLEEAQALTPQSDFKRFAAADVAPEVKNVALKKLFADPRYNIMDGMDVYIDDYSKPDPMPYSMLRQLASAKFLGLFDQEEKEEAAAETAAQEAGRQARDVADNPNAQTVAQSDAAPQAVPEPPQHADPDLRLQQDHAAPGEDPGHGTG
jgi:hypothetical protein